VRKIGLVGLRGWIRSAWRACALVFCSATASFAAVNSAPLSPTNIFAPDSTPARSIFHLSAFVLEICAAIFVIVFSLLVYAVIKFRERKGDTSEPPQVYGSNQMELAWTVLPVLIVVVLFLSTAQVIHRVQDARAPADAVQVTVVGHQFWWDFEYPQYHFSTANELHVPLSTTQDDQPTFLKLLSADVVHSFWVPRLAGKTDLIPNHPNTTWINPQQPGLYLGQCASFCGTGHADMLLSVYVQTPADFQRWVKEQEQPAVNDPSVAAGRALFIAKTCFACHTIRGTIAAGRVGPDLTHLMSRNTIAAGILPNTPANLRKWIHDPAAVKPGTLMPKIDMTPDQLNQIAAYLETLK
jgi:cytochrome c oxidase subunit 2